MQVDRSYGVSLYPPLRRREEAAAYPGTGSPVLPSFHQWPKMIRIAVYESTVPAGTVRKVRPRKRALEPGAHIQRVDEHGERPNPHAAHPHEVIFHRAALGPPDRLNHALGV